MEGPAASHRQHPDRATPEGHRNHRPARVLHQAPGAPARAAPGHPPRGRRPDCRWLGPWGGSAAFASRGPLHPQRRGIAAARKRQLADPRRHTVAGASPGPGIARAWRDADPRPALGPPGRGWPGNRRGRLPEQPTAGVNLDDAASGPGWTRRGRRLDRQRLHRPRRLDHGSERQPGDPVRAGLVLRPGCRGFALHAGRLRAHAERPRHGRLRRLQRDHELRRGVSGPGRQRRSVGHARQVSGDRDFAADPVHARDRNAHRSGSRAPGRIGSKAQGRIRSRAQALRVRAQGRFGFRAQGRFGFSAQERGPRQDAASRAPAARAQCRGRLRRPRNLPGVSVGAEGRPTRAACTSG